MLDDFCFIRQVRRRTTSEWIVEGDIKQSFSLIIDSGSVRLSSQESPKEVERDYQCQVLSIIDLDDLMQFIEKEPDYQQYLPAMRAYRESYGV